MSNSSKSAENIQDINRQIIPKNENKLEKNFNFITFISGGIAGSVAKTLVAPIDRCKILLQVHNVHYENYGIIESFKKIIQQEGFLSLYKGNGAQMLRIFPYAALQFTSYEFFKRLNKKIFKEEASERIINNLLCGSMAGITAVTFTYPLDVIRSRLAFQFKGEHIYSGIFDSIRKIYAENFSIKSFYRGYLITVIGMVPYAGLSFTSYERIRLYILKKNYKYLTAESDIKTNHPDKYYELTVPGKLICGGITAVLAQTITYPLDVVRRHMQLVTMFKDSAIRQKMGIYDTIIYVYSKYGIIRGLYRGITLNYIRAVPMVSTSFCFYELSKKVFGLNTGELIKLG